MRLCVCVYVCIHVCVYTCMSVCNCVCNPSPTTHTRTRGTDIHPFQPPSNEQVSITVLATGFSLNPTAAEGDQLDDLLTTLDQQLSAPRPKVRFVLLPRRSSPFACVLPLSTHAVAWAHPNASNTSTHHSRPSRPRPRPRRRRCCPPCTRSLPTPRAPLGRPLPARGPRAATRPAAAAAAARRAWAGSSRCLGDRKREWRRLGWVG